ncbi:RNA polymerase [Western grey kangaroopox virus]|uniref:DNA-directed RNA polymerase 30 kDa polypeptide n=1 Tax=Western grey kangaroopox virus TaxID=1566307 RepID=A0A2C9DSJ3_9POXV|nr:RNA polymerase [Western grey kangaroopox virus]ATI20976.1 RNA polymerase [Western grey kangaroopox virus]
MDFRGIVSKYVNCENAVERLLEWATRKSAVYYLRNINNTKVNIEETKFDAVNNFGIEYSKDNKYKLSYRNKPLIPTNIRYSEICDLIKSTSGSDKETLRYLLFGIKCLHADVEYDIDRIPDYNYDKYFKVLDDNYNLPCPACRCHSTTPMILQTRASDEEPTVRYVCKECGKNFSPPRFKFNNNGTAQDTQN